MPDYQQGKIYTLRCKTDDTLIYVGSTIQPLCERLAGHKRDSRRECKKNMLIYRTINNDWENWYIELYELYPCGCKEELCKREGEIIRLIGNLNTNIAGRTGKEWVEDNKERMTEWYKKWYIDHKELLQEQNKIWRENNKEKQKEYNKEWEEDHKDKRQEQNKKRYEKNKDILSEKIPCECGCMIRRSDLKRHLKSKKHINLMEKLTN